MGSSQSPPLLAPPPSHRPDPSLRRHVNLSGGGRQPTAGGIGGRREEGGSHTHNLFLSTPPSLPIASSSLHSDAANPNPKEPPPPSSIAMPWTQHPDRLPWLPIDGEPSDRHVFLICFGMYIA